MAEEEKRQEQNSQEEQPTAETEKATPEESPAQEEVAPAVKTQSEAEKETPEQAEAKSEAEETVAESVAEPAAESVEDDAAPAQEQTASDEVHSEPDSKEGGPEGPQKILNVLDEQAEKNEDQPALEEKSPVEGQASEDSPHDLPLPPGVEEPSPQEPHSQEKEKPQEEPPSDTPPERPGLDNSIEPELMISEAMKRLDKMLDEIKSAEEGAASENPDGSDNAEAEQTEPSEE